MSSRLLGAGVLAVVLGVAVVGAVHYLGGGTDPQAQPIPIESPKTPDKTPDKPQLENRTAKSFSVDEKQVPREDRLQMPDGTWAMALNGVKNPGPLNWPRDIPYAPIVERRMGKDGLERYRHADGSWSWTQLQYRQDLGRMDSVTLLANPTATLPMEDLSSPNTPKK